MNVKRFRLKDFTKNHSEFYGTILKYGDFLQELLELKDVRREKQMKGELVEAWVLWCAARWEVLVVKDIITSIKLDPSAYSRELGLRLRKRLTQGEAEAMVVGHRYLDFKGVDQIKGFAKRHLADKLNPFQAISNEMAKTIDEFMVMRNYIAHGSSYAKRKYRERIKIKYSLKKIPEPGYFLLARDPKTKYRWRGYEIAFLECSESMAKSVKESIVFYSK